MSIADSTPPDGIGKPDKPNKPYTERSERRKGEAEQGQSSFEVTKGHLETRRRGGATGLDLVVLDKALGEPSG